MDRVERRRRTWVELHRLNLESMIVSHLPNVLYLAGFTGSAGVLAVSRGKWAFFTDGRYTEQARAEVKGTGVVMAKGPAIVAAAEWIQASGVKTVGIEAEHLTVSAVASLRPLWKGSVRQRPTAGVIERLRMVKDGVELELIRKAVALGDSLLEVALQRLRPGLAERKVAAEIEYRAKECGASGMSFDTIVAAGKRSALPHGCASGALIPKRGFAVLDFGVVLNHYCSDMTRTVHVGRISSNERALYEAVRDAQQAALEAVHPGVEAGEVDAAARRVLRRARLAKYFTHSTGHGVGLEIHEAPRMAKGVKDVLELGMVITIEPGAYIPGRGGVRIEDMVVVTETGCEVLTQAPKDLVIV